MSRDWIHARRSIGKYTAAVVSEADAEDAGQRGHSRTRQGGQFPRKGLSGICRNE